MSPIRPFLLKDIASPTSKPDGIIPKSQILAFETYVEWLHTCTRDDRERAVHDLGYRATLDFQRLADCAKKLVNLIEKEDKGKSSQRDTPKFY